MPSILSLHRLPPIITTSALALLIDCCSNISAQRIRHWRLSDPVKPTPYVFNYVLFFQFAFMVTLTAPLNYLWQNWLERTFPGWKVMPGNGKRRGEEDIELGDKDDELREGLLEGGLGDVEEERVRDWQNIAKKWFTDCITFGALFNTTAFLVLMGLMKHKSFAQIGYDLRHEMWPIIFNSYKIWPIGNIISTTFVPVEKRIVFLSSFGFFWNLYLSFVAMSL